LLAGDNAAEAKREPFAVRRWTVTVRGVPPIVRAGALITSVLTVALLSSTNAQAAAGECGTGWSVLPSPNAGSGDNRLSGVTAVSASDAWAVGSFQPTGGGSKTLIQHWDGTVWTIVPSPNAGGPSTLAAIDALSANDAWAVGNFVADPFSEGGHRTLTEHWNGSAWELVPSPNDGVEGGNGRLFGVFAPASNNVWAVGSSFPDVEFPTRQPLIEHWDGEEWQIVPGPSRSPGPWSELFAVSGTSPTDLWAVGVRDAQVGERFTERALILHWDGEAWKRVRAPLPASRLTPFRLLDVVALTPNDAWAVGTVATRTTHRTVAMHWDGEAWKLVRSANPSAQFQDLAGVAARSSARVWAVGAYFDAGVDRMRTLVERWDGERFRKVSSGNRGHSDLNDVSAVRGMRFAVGASGVVRPRTLVVRRCVTSARLIAFASDRDGDSEIYVVRTDGTGLRKLTRNRAGDAQPVWSPDRRRIAFVSDRDGDEDLYVMRADGSDVRRITRNAAGDFLPAWSPGGRRLAFTSTLQGSLDVYTIRADGRHRRRLTYSPAIDYGPAWSPDGSRIAFASNRRGGEGNQEIFVMNADGSDKRRLTFTGGSFEFPMDDTFPSWSPDGATIVFSSSREVSEDLWVMDADGENQHALAQTPSADEYQASYSPGGTRLLYTRDVEGRPHEIWIARADGAEARRLTAGS
jgi:hypothetical protein